MTEVQNPESGTEIVEPGEFSVIDGELIEDAPPVKRNISVSNAKKTKPEIINKDQKLTKKEPVANQIDLNRQSAIRHYLLLPLIFLTVTMLGGLRLNIDTNAFIFLKPELVCLIFAAILLVLFFRAGLIRLDGWFSDGFSTLKNIANASVLFTLFTASVQIFNGLLPEKGLPFWIVGLLFFWTLWNNLFSVFTAKRLVQSLGSLFGLAFVLKYLILANLTAPTSDGWLKAIFENPGKELFTYLLDLPKFSAGTGYIQFFTVVFYVAGLFLLSPFLTVETIKKENENQAE